FRRGLLVLVGRVEMTGAGARFELDLLASTFCHGRNSLAFAARAEVGDALLDADLVDQAQGRVRDAQAHPAVLAFDPEPAVLQVGQEAALRFVVGVGHVVPDHRALARNLTDACHDASPWLFWCGCRRGPQGAPRGSRPGSGKAKNYS